MIENDKRKLQLNADTTSIVLFIATLLWMAFIFYMSSQTGEDSAFLSGSLSEGLAKLANSLFGGNAPPKLLKLIRNELILRKVGHVFEYLVLGILVYSLVRRQGFRGAQDVQGTRETQEAGREAQDAQVSQGVGDSMESPDLQGTSKSTTGERIVPQLQNKREVARKVLIAILICTVYAASDELHQMLVPGRAPMIADTLLDSISSATGVMLTWAIARDWRSDFRRT